MIELMMALWLTAQAPESKTKAPPDRVSEKSAKKGPIAQAATPEQAMRSFIVAMMTKDEATLRAVTLPTDDFDWLLQGSAIPKDQTKEFKAQIARMPIRVLKPGEEITLPGNRKVTIKPEEVTADRAMLLPQGTPFPVSCRKINGRWNIDATPIIAGIEALAPAPNTVDLSKLKDTVTISIGKNLAVAFAQKANALAGPKIVENAKKATPAVTFDFQKQDANLMLITQNPYAKDLKFRAMARLKGHKDYFETSIVPVGSGLFGVELWQEPIEELVLFDFKLIDGEP